jgi:hypothetical protein
VLAQIKLWAIPASQLMQLVLQHVRSRGTAGGWT